MFVFAFLDLIVMAAKHTFTVYSKVSDLQFFLYISSLTGSMYLILKKYILVQYSFK